MKVWSVIEIETVKDEDKRKKYYEYLDIHRSLMNKKLEGVKYKFLGGWSDNPGWVMSVTEFESMEEFAKVWGDEEVQKSLLRLRNHCKSVRVRIMRPTVIVR
jgi:DNA-binding PadR family transcriptional regulator